MSTETSTTDKRRRYQAVCLLLSDGRKVYYSGFEQVHASDSDLRVVNIKFHEGLDLPSDCYFDVLSTDGKCITPARQARCFECNEPADGDTPSADKEYWVSWCKEHGKDKKGYKPFKVSRVDK